MRPPFLLYCAYGRIPVTRLATMHSSPTIAVCENMITHYVCVVCMHACQSVRTDALPILYSSRRVTVHFCYTVPVVWPYSSPPILPTVLSVRLCGARGWSSGLCINLLLLCMPRALLLRDETTDTSADARWEQFAFQMYLFRYVKITVHNCCCCIYSASISSVCVAIEYALSVSAQHIYKLLFQ